MYLGGLGTPVTSNKTKSNKTSTKATSPPASPASAPTSESRRGGGRPEVRKWCPTPRPMGSSWKRRPSVARPPLRALDPWTAPVVELGPGPPGGGSSHTF